MEVLWGRVALAVLCSVFIEKAAGQNIVPSSNQVIQSSNINTDNVNYNTIQNGYKLGRPTANYYPSVVNAGVAQGAQSVSSVQQANIQQANVQQTSNNLNPYAGSSTSSSTSVSEQSISSSPGLRSPSGVSNIQAANIQATNIAGLSGQQQYQNVNQNSAITQVQTAQNGQSLSTTSNQVAVSNQNVRPTYQNLPINRYPFGGNFEIPLNLEVNLPPVSIAVADQLDQPVATLPSSLPPQQPYPNPYSFPYFPIPYSTGGCSSRSGIGNDLLPLFLIALCNNNGGRCGGGQRGGCCNGCNNCIPVPVPIPVPFNPVIVKCGGDDDSSEEED